MAWTCRQWRWWWWAVAMVVGTGWVCTLRLEQYAASSYVPRPVLWTSSLAAYYNTYHNIYHNTSRLTSTPTDYNHSNTTRQTVSQAAIVSTGTQRGTRAPGGWHHHQDPGQSSSPAQKESTVANDWESVMSVRRARVSRVCRHHYTTLKRFSIFNRLTFDTKHHLAYCRNAKAGTTSWLTTLLEWAGADVSNMTSHQIHDAATDTFPPLATEDAAREMRVPALTFVMARHPFSRLVSAYRDKIPANYKKDLQLKMIAKYRGQQKNGSSSEDEGISAVHNSQTQAKFIDKSTLNDVKRTNISSYSKFIEMKNDSLSINQAQHKMQLTTALPSTIMLDPGFPTFREFVLYVSDQVQQCLPRISSACTEKIDVHWQPLYDRCAPCDIQYDVIAKTETFAEDEKYLNQLTGIPLQSTGSSKLQITRGPSTAHLTKTYFSTLSDIERQKVFSAFYYDFLLFGYSYDDMDFK